VRACPTCSYLSMLFERSTPTEIYTLSLHDALPILEALERWDMRKWFRDFVTKEDGFPSKPAPDALNFLLEKHALARENCAMVGEDRKSTRLNSSHVSISYAVFCLKKKN